MGEKWKDRHNEKVRDGRQAGGYHSEFEDNFEQADREEVQQGKPEYNFQGQNREARRRHRDEGFSTHVNRDFEYPSTENTPYQDFGQKYSRGDNERNARSLAETSNQSQEGNERSGMQMEGNWSGAGRHQTHGRYANQRASQYYAGSGNNESPSNVEMARRGAELGRGYGESRYGRSEDQINRSHSGKGPKGYTKSDQRIEEQVCEALCDHHEIDASNIQVEVKNGEVTLSGFVDQRNIKRTAEEVVENVSGVKQVYNNLRVGSANQQQSSNESQRDRSDQRETL